MSISVILCLLIVLLDLLRRVISVNIKVSSSKMEGIGLKQQRVSNDAKIIHNLDPLPPIHPTLS
jgi:hypothetical protein